MKYQVSNRAFWAAVILSGCAILSLGRFAHSGPSGPEVSSSIKTKLLEVVDQQGRTRIRLTATDTIPTPATDGSPTVMILDSKGQPMAFMAQLLNHAVIAMGHEVSEADPNIGTVGLIADEMGSRLTLHGVGDNSGMFLNASSDKRYAAGGTIVFTDAHDTGTKVIRPDKPDK